MGAALTEEAVRAALIFSALDEPGRCIELAAMITRAEKLGINSSDIERIFVHTLPSTIEVIAKDKPSKCSVKLPDYLRVVK